jgi:hypothetical protein
MNAMTPQPHVIGRQVLDLEIEAGSDAFTLQNQVCEVFQTYVLPAMTALLDRYAEPGTLVRLDRLELNVGRLKSNQLAEDFAVKVCEALESELSAALAGLSQTASSSLGERWSADEHTLNLWHHVIQNGYLPWWASPASAADLEGRMVEVLDACDALPDATVKMLKENPVAVRRLALQGSETLLNRVLQLMDKGLAAAGVSVRDALFGLLEAHPIATLRTETLRRSFWEASLNEGLRSATRASDSRVSSLLRQLMLMTARDTAVTYRELLTHIRTFIEPTGESVVTPSRASKRRVLAAAIYDLMASGELPRGAVHRQVPGGMQGHDPTTRGQPPVSTDSRQFEGDLPPQDPGPIVAKELRPDADRSIAYDIQAAASESAPDARDAPHVSRNGLPPQESGSVTKKSSVGPNEALPPQERVASCGVSKTKEGAPTSPTPLNQDAARSVVGGGLDAVTDPDPTARDATPAFDDFPLSGRVGNRSTSASTLESGQRERSLTPGIREGNAIYVDDAGIALLHPFLQKHFEKLELWRKGGFVDDDSRERAVHQLRFLATGEEEAREYALVFAKILCGLSPDIPIARTVPLDKHAKSEADRLLKAVIRHWGALKNTSPDGLRETFLHREGRLTRKADGWRLKVASRSFDLLLDRLPWSLSVIQLPWMPELLWIEWI